MGAPALKPRSRPRPKPTARPKPAGRPRAAAPAPERRAVATPRKPRQVATPRKPRAAATRKPRAAATRKPRAASGASDRSRSRIAAPGNVALLPVNAVGGIADSGFVVGMSRGRAWIVVLGVLLGGIVALNVLGLSLSSSGSDAATKVDELQQANSVLRARIANRTSNERIAEAAGALGLAVPAPDAVDYLKARAADAETAAKRIADGLIANAPPASTDPAVSTDPAASTVDPVTGAPIDPTATTAAGAPVDPTATTAATAPVDPTATTIVPAP